MAGASPAVAQSFPVRSASRTTSTAASDGDAFLTAIVAVADGHGAILESLLVEGEAVGRADLVVARVALTDGVLLVVLGRNAGREEARDDLRSRA